MKQVKYSIILWSLLLSSCSLLSPVKTEPSATYLLNTVPHCLPKKQTRPLTLLVLPPDTRPVYNTTLMAYTIKPYQVSYFARNQWAETPSQMLLPLIVQTLQNTHYFHAVVTPPYSGRYNYLLTTQILTLQQNYICCPHVVEMSVRAQLLRGSTSQVVATKQFNVLVPIRQRTPYCGVYAANRATAIILTELAYFCLDYAK